MTIKTFSTLITEKKDHIINKLPLLTPEQKREVIDFFTRKPNLERKIDWNKGLKLAWEDFVDVMREVSKTERKKAVKQHGIAGLKEHTDYVELKIHDDNTYQAYIPLHWEASKLIASAKIGGCEGAWCIAYQKDISYWKLYTQKKKQLPIFIVGDHAKWSVMVHENDRDFDVWDHYDVHQDDDDIPGLDIYKQVIKPNAHHLFDKLRQDHFTYKHFIEGAQIKNAKYRIDDEGFIHWESGEWISGEWDDGEWLKGTWNAGQWKEGHWHTGHWLFGLWENGTWHDGQWDDGTWYDGIWIKGLWLNGTWKKGTWNGGTWYDGIWKEGEWKGGKWNGGIWNNGTWKEGEWNSGIWLGGEWLGGIWNDGWWEKGTWHGGKWRRGTWGGGTWLGGEWHGGRDVNGVWHEQYDSPDKWIS